MEQLIPIHVLDVVALLNNKRISNAAINRPTPSPLNMIRSGMPMKAWIESENRIMRKLENTAIRRLD